MKNIENTLERHEAFLECRPADRPLLGPWASGYYPAEQYPCGTSQWHPGEMLRPEDIHFEEFAADYENLYESHQTIGGDFGFVASAYWGIPWLEAMMGCPVTVAKANCCARPAAIIPEKPVDLDANPWMDVLLHFTKELVALAADRFPVCPPLLRGPGDTTAALLGEMNYVTGFFDDPDRMRTILDACAQTRLGVIERLQAEIPAWCGIHAVGGYPSMVWSCNTVAYHQEDSAAVVNPKIFREFLLPALKVSCRAAEVNFIHLHSACLYPVDILLGDDSFKVLQINVDHRGMGPPVEKLLSTFQKIQAAGRPLVLWGEFSDEEWSMIQEKLSPIGLSLQPIVHAHPGIPTSDDLATQGDDRS